MGCGASTASPPAPKIGVVAPVRTEKKHQSYDEWKRSEAAKRLSMAMASEDSRVALQALFKALDADGDGKLTSEEWMTGLASRSEFMKKHFGESSVEEQGEAFVQLDLDGNGSLSWEEFEEGARKLRDDAGGVPAVVPEASAAAPATAG